MRPPIPIVSALLLVAAAGCTPIVDVDNRNDDSPVHVIIGSDRPRELAPEVSAGELAELVAARNHFAFELYHQLRDGADDFTYSPVSIATAVARVHAGARGETEQELAASLVFPAAQPVLHAGLNRLDLDLTGARPGFEYHSVQAVWAQVGLPYRVDYLDLLAESYGGDLHLVDFERQPDQARSVINQWMSDQTGGAAGDLVPPGAITAAPTVLFSNAITVSALWRDEFPAQLTYPAPFTLEGGGTVTVQMMVSQEDDCCRYASGAGYQAMELGFLGDDLAMVVILPDPGQLQAIEDQLDGTWVAELVAALAPTNLAISLPRWTVESRLRLDELLASLGVSESFTARADFSGITGNLDLRLGSLAHHARVVIDERGINATTGTLGISDANPDRVVVDRPFLFLVRDVATDAILFAGRVRNPADG